MQTIEQSPYTAQELQKLVVDWIVEKQCQLDSQVRYINDEFGELNKAINKNKFIDIVDGLGDVLVTIIGANYLSDRDYLQIDNILTIGNEKVNTCLLQCMVHLGKKEYQAAVKQLYCIATIYGVNLLDCLYFAYKEIKDRTGETVNGVFVKDVPNGQYYKGQDGVDVIDLQKQFNLNPYDFNVLKYIVRGGKKPNEDVKKDFKKALDYIELQEKQGKDLSDYSFAEIAGMFDVSQQRKDIITLILAANLYTSHKKEYIAEAKNKIQEEINQLK